MTKFAKELFKNWLVVLSIRMRDLGRTWFAESIENIHKENETPDMFLLAYSDTAVFRLTHDL